MTCKHYTIPYEQRQCHACGCDFWICPVCAKWAANSWYCVDCTRLAQRRIAAQAGGNFEPIREYGRLVRGQAVKINAGKYAGCEGVILDDKSGGYYKINVAPQKWTIEAADIHEDDFTAIERLSMFTTTLPQGGATGGDSV